MRPLMAFHATILRPLMVFLLQQQLGAAQPRPVEVQLSLFDLHVDAVQDVNLRLPPRALLEVAEDVLGSSPPEALLRV